MSQTTTLSSKNIVVTGAAQGVGLGGLVPERRRDISKMGLKAMLAGSLSNMMSARTAGVLLFW